MDLQPNAKTIKLLRKKKERKSSQPWADDNFLQGISKAQKKPKIIQWTAEKYSQKIKIKSQTRKKLFANIHLRIYI